MSNISMQCKGGGITNITKEDIINKISGQDLIDIIYGTNGEGAIPIYDGLDDALLPQNIGAVSGKGFLQSVNNEDANTPHTLIITP